MQNRAIFPDKAPISLADAHRAFILADGAWTIELDKKFGRNAGDARYDKRGEGEPGTKLREVYEARKAASDQWHALRNAN